MTLEQIIYQATVPSNIAFLKYWGKRDEAQQWPANDSLSMTLAGLHSRTKASIQHSPDHLVCLNGVSLTRSHEMGAKIFQHLDFLSDTIATTTKLNISSENSFPTGCGIASSASGMGALTLAALAAWLDCNSFEALAAKSFSRDKLAHLARQGSGSAGRSLFGGIVRWRAGNSPEQQSIATAFSHAHWPLMDTVVLFSKSPKTVGSTEAHRGAWTSPLFAPRLAELSRRIQLMEEAIEKRTISELGPLIEQETLEMHGVIMSASPAVRYFGQETSDFLSWLRERRQQLGLDVYFTLDAGPNVHLIYENHIHEDLMSLLAEKFSSHQILSDKMGAGPSLSVLVEEG